MALDEPVDTDNNFKFEGFEFLVNKDFLQKVQPIRVDFVSNNFKLDCNMQFDSGCTSCGTSGSSCST